MIFVLPPESFRICRERGYSILVQTDEGTYMSQETFDLWSSLLREKAGISVSLSGIAISPSFPPDARISKFLYISPDGRIDEIRSSLGPRFSVIDNTVGLPADLMGEVVLSSISKLTGIEAIGRKYAIVSRLWIIADKLWHVVWALDPSAVLSIPLHPWQQSCLGREPAELL